MKSIKIGDIVRIRSNLTRKEKSQGPGWDPDMNNYLGKALKVQQLHSTNNSFSTYGYWWLFDWVEEYINPDTLTKEQRICNKIKELDQKWKERTQNVHCNS